MLDLSTLTPGVQDILVQIKSKASAAVGSDKVLNWFAAGTVGMDSTKYTGDVAADTTYATFSGNLVQYPNVIFGRPVAIQDTSQQYGGPFSLALLFGGVLPKKVIIGVWNRTNVSLSSTGSEHAISYQVVYSQA